MTVKAYFSLTKPRMILGNLIIATAGFLLASHTHFNFSFLIFTLLGLGLVIASGCVFNNYIDRNIDTKMLRTKDRSFPQQKVSGKNALIFGIILGLSGLIILFIFTNLLTTFLALLGALIYVCVYSPLKHTTHHAALIGSVAGALPPVIGYTAVSNSFNLEALILFLILALWQMPHFYSISIYRLDEYRSAGVPVFPVQKNIFITKIFILLYILIFTLAASSLTFFKYTSLIYLAIIITLSINWLLLSLKFFSITEKAQEKFFARKLFFYSLIVLMIFAVTISVGSFV